MSEATTLIAGLIRERADTHPDLDVLTFEYEGQTETRSYRQLWENGQRVAESLARLGVARGGRFALLMYNHPEFVESMVASAILGIVFVPIDPRLRGEKLAYLLRNAECEGAICGPYALDSLLEVSPDLPALRWACVLGDSLPEHRSTRLSVEPVGPYLHAPVPAPLRRIATKDDTEPMQVMYTSGTTGDPKGIVVTHGRFAVASNYGSLFGYRPDDRPYTGLSLTHGNAQFATLAPSLKMGLRAVISRKFTKSRLWDILRRHGCTTFTLLGGMATAIYSEARRNDDADTPVRLVISAGMPAAIGKDFASRFAVEIFEFYAAMEGGMTFQRPGEGPIGSCGRVAPGLIAKVVDDEGREVPAGQPGEIWFRPADGSPPLVSYLGNPEASAKKTEGGWLHSGDIVRRDADGWVFYVCRKGGGIRRNGEFLDPAFIEKTLAECPLVDDVFVYGVPAESGAPGESDVVAAVVAKEIVGFQPEEVFEWLQGRLEPSLWPQFIQQVATIPRTASEKPQERFLIELFQNRPDTVTRLVPARSTTGGR